jgi:multidrug efflux system outer membrane protein
MIIRHFSFLLCFGLLGGCTLGPDYVRPELPKAEVFPEAGKGGAAVRAEWWKSLGDPELDALVAKALAANADLRVAVGRVEQAAAVLGETEGAALPQVDAVGGVNASKLSEGAYNQNLATTGRHRTSARGGLSTSFELDFWGKLRRAEESARAQLLGAREARRMVELSVGAAVVRAYAALRAADAQSSAAQEVFAARDEEAAIIAKRADVGAAGPQEIAQAEVARSAAVTALADARRTRAAAEHLLGMLTGQPALTIVARRQDGLRLPAPVAPGLPADLLASRPDVVAAEQVLVAANARIGYVKAARFPSFTLTGAIGSESRELNALFDGATATSTLGVDLRYPLFDFGRGAARVEGAVAEQHQAAAAYEKAFLNACREVRDALVDVRETAASASAAARRALAAEDAYRIATVRSREGQAGPMELLAARRLRAESQVAVAKVRQDRLAAQVDLVRALGGVRPDVASAK